MGLFAHVALSLQREIMLARSAHQSLQNVHTRNLQETTMTIPRLFLGAALASLTLASAVMAADAEPAPAAVAKERMICRYDKETGSLVKGKKTCHTKAQWQYIDDTNQSFANRLVDDARTKSVSN
jgi:hypothetical protein